MGTGITLDQDAVTTAVSIALVQQLESEHRDAILAQAIQYLVTPVRSTFGAPGTSPMQDAVNSAIGVAARQVAHQIVENDEEIQTQLRDTLRSAVTEALSDVEAVREAVGSAVAALLRRADEEANRF